MYYFQQILLYNLLKKIHILLCSQIVNNMNNILFALAYTYKHDDEADKWKRAEYESLYFSLYKEAVKVFGKKELEDLGIEDNIEKTQTRY